MTTCVWFRIEANRFPGISDTLFPWLQNFLQLFLCDPMGHGLIRIFLVGKPDRKRGNFFLTKTQNLSNPFCGGRRIGQKSRIGIDESPLFVGCQSYQPTLFAVVDKNTAAFRKKFLKQAVLIRSKSLIKIRIENLEDKKSCRNSNGEKNQRSKQNTWPPSCRRTSLSGRPVFPRHNRSGIFYSSTSVKSSSKSTEPA